jgi:hypothetical protein
VAFLTVNEDCKRANAPRETHGLGSTLDKAHPGSNQRDAAAPSRPWPRRIAILVWALFLGTAISPSAIAARSHGPQISIVVGPVGEALTPIYVELAEQVAISAERSGATARRAYSPNATPEHVLAAVDGADIIVYLGHGTGYPNPCSATLNPETANGWGLQGAKARGTHDDSLADGSLAYFGEAWIARHARPAPGFVMIYSNVCYAPGAGEGHDAPSTPDVAAQRAGHYSRTPLAMGASAVFATDFYLGAASMVDALLGSPSTPYGEVFAADPRFDAAGLATMDHPYAAPGNELWLHRSRYFDGKLDYWYAFAGDPAASFAGAGSGLSSPRTYAPARDGTLLAGDHELVRFGDDGAIAGRRTLNLAAASAVTFSARQRQGDDPASWLQLGSLEPGWWVAESPAAYVGGIAAQGTLAPPRELELASGTHAAHAFDRSGAVVDARTLTLDEAEVTVADAEAVINGQRYVRVRDGDLAGFWIQPGPGVRLGAFLPPDPPSAESLAPDPTMSSSESPAPTPAVAEPSAAETAIPPPPPQAPPEAAAPSAPPSTTPTPPAAPSPPASPPPSATSSIGPSAAPTPTPTPLVTPVPTAVPPDATVEPSLAGTPGD